MMTLAPWKLILLAALLVPGDAAAQPVADCSHAKTAIEKAICGNPDLAAADAAMARAYAGLRAGLPADQKAMLLPDQQQWIGMRNVQCTDKTGDELNKCVLAATEERRRFLAGEGPNGAIGAPSLAPAFFREQRKGNYNIAIQYPRIVGPANPVAAAFNHAARETAFGKNAAASVREMGPAKGVPENFYLAGYEITYLAPRLASIVFTIATYEGGAHPNHGRVTLLFDLAAGRPLSLADVLSDPKQSVAAIAVPCKTKLEATAKEEGWELFDNADVAAVVGDAREWAVHPDGVEILFDPYAIASYAEGDHACRLSYDELKPWLKPGGALPPR